jgi:hypothetical protein
MSIIIILSLICVLCTAIMFLSKEYGKVFPIINIFSFSFLLSFIVIGCIIRSSFIVIEYNYIVIKNQMEEYKQTKDKTSVFTKQSLADEAIRINKELSRARYLENSVFEIFIPDSFSTRDYLK